jgi:SIR2-like domain
MIDRPESNHNVYILGAGFSRDSGIPVIKDFLERMASSVEWLYENDRSAEAAAIERVFEFRRRAANATYRININVDNIEDLFSLASASEFESFTIDVTTAIAATLDFARLTTQQLECKVEKKKIINESGTWERYKTSYTIYQLYAGILSGIFCDNSRGMKNTVITFNYDTLLEDALLELGGSFNYGLTTESADYHTSAKLTIHDIAANPLYIYKLHGSVNWSIRTNPEDMIEIYRSYEDIRTEGERILLMPPTWQKAFSGHFMYLWKKAVEALNAATRIIVIGFSMPPTDIHFKYLLAAGLQNNISLRKFLFINPGLSKDDESKYLRNNLFRILRPELEERGVVELQALSTRNFLLSQQSRSQIKRDLLEDILSIDYPRDDYATRYIDRI